MPSMRSVSVVRQRLRLRVGETIVELGEHADAAARERETVPRVGLRLYVVDVDATYASAVAAGASGDAPSNRFQGTRAATVHDPFGVTWWLAATLADPERDST